MTESTVIRWDQDEDGIVVLTLDDPEHSANTMNAAYRESWPRPLSGWRRSRTASPAS